MTQPVAGRVISSILKHDRKETSYKIALLRAINDVVLSYPDVRSQDKSIAVPLSMLAEFWVAYYWPFVDPDIPILQGRRSLVRGTLRNDMSFRPELTDLYRQWQTYMDGRAKPSDGFFLINELRVARRRREFSTAFLRQYEVTLQAIAEAIKMPIQHAGPRGVYWDVFRKPVRYRDIVGEVIPVPKTKPQDLCLVIEPELWDTFQDVSLWVEALCIHQWCLFTETVSQELASAPDRGDVYRLLTDRPDNRRPLTWERNQVDLVIMEGKQFICPWTEKLLRDRIPYDIDHLVPVAVYPINELWNLIPTDPEFNQRVKRHRLPTDDRLLRATPHLAGAYSIYRSAKPLAEALYEDAAVRFTGVPSASPDFADTLAHAVVGFIQQITELRNIERF